MKTIKEVKDNSIKLSNDINILINNFIKENECFPIVTQRIRCITSFDIEYYKSSEIIVKVEI